ncbi:hypothetical protein [Agaribacillus aureus]|uniref:hypothetical protein n=1 Tax=Agaribacillus aureus TaxID=3051825 RepID=UPI0032119A3E
MSIIITTSIIIKTTTGTDLSAEDTIIITPGDIPMATTKPTEVRQREAEGTGIITVVPEEAAKTAASEAGEVAATVKAVGSKVEEAVAVPAETVRSKAEEVAAVPAEAVPSKAEEVAPVPVEVVPSKVEEAAAASKMGVLKVGQARVTANKAGSKAGEVVVLPIKVVLKAEGWKTTIKPRLQDRARGPVTKAAGKADQKAVAAPANAR